MYSEAGRQGAYQGGDAIDALWMASRFLMTLSAWTRLHATTSSQAKPLDSFQSSAAKYVSTAVRDGGSIVGAVVTFSDESEWHHAEVTPGRAHPPVITADTVDLGAVS